MQRPEPSPLLREKNKNKNKKNKSRPVVDQLKYNYYLLKIIMHTLHMSGTQVAQKAQWKSMNRQSLKAPGKQ
jgi:hypothetical protein